MGSFSLWAILVGKVSLSVSYLLSCIHVLLFHFSWISVILRFCLFRLFSHRLVLQTNLVLLHLLHKYAIFYLCPLLLTECQFKPTLHWVPFSPLLLLTCRTIFLWMANFAMMCARRRCPLYLQAGSTQALGSRHGQAKVMRRRSLLLRDLLLSWMWCGACSTSRVENCSKQIRNESSRSACFSGSRTLERGLKRCWVEDCWVKGGTDRVFAAQSTRLTLHVCKDLTMLMINNTKNRVVSFQVVRFS